MIKKCSRCGQEFEAERDSALFCSDVCRVEASRIIKKVMEKSDMAYDRQKNLDAFNKMGLAKTAWITTGIEEFDKLTKIPRGRITQIQGPEGVGKTTLCLNMVRGMKGLKVLYIDSEASLNPHQLVDLEVEADNFKLYNDEVFIEDIYDVIVEATQKPTYDIIIFDSLAACTFKNEAANEAADANIGQKAKIVNKLMRIIPNELRKTKTALVIINQERVDIGGFTHSIYTPGGKGVDYAASLKVRLKTTKGARFPAGGPPFKGHEIEAEIIKSKVNEPWRKRKFKLYYAATEESLAETEELRAG